LPPGDVARFTPADRDAVALQRDRVVHLTNLRTVYFVLSERSYTKGDLLRYYATVARRCCRISAIAPWSCGATPTASTARIAHGILPNIGTTYHWSPRHPSKDGKAGSGL
jgi:hypothetical protein